jgi:hypothetical protein
MPQHLLIVFTECVPGREAAFNLWYDDVHIPRMLGIPGFLAARRFALGDAGNAPPPGRFLALIELGGETPEPALQARRDRRGSVPISEALVSTKAWVYSAIEPVYGGEAAGSLRLSFAARATPGSAVFSPHQLGDQPPPGRYLSFGTGGWRFDPLGPRRVGTGK